MSRATRRIATLLIAAAVLAACAPLAPPAVALRQVGPHTWYAQGVHALASRANRGFISNAGVVVTPAGVIVIDSLGSPPLAAELVAAIRRLPGVRSDTPIRTVIVTHFHADHIYGLQVLKAAGAEVWANRGAAEYLASDGAKDRLAITRAEVGPHVDENTRLVAPDVWLDGDVSLDSGGVRLQVLHAGPAHTPEDTFVYVEPDGVVFAGDLVFRGRVPFVGEGDGRRWLAALERILALGPRVVVPGHGAASGDPPADLAFTRDYLVFLRESMRKVAENLDPFDEAYRATDWSRYAGLPLFEEANRPNAYNTFLRMEREAGR